MENILWNIKGPSKREIGHGSGLESEKGMEEHKRGLTPALSHLELAWEAFMWPRSAQRSYATTKILGSPATPDLPTEGASSGQSSNGFSDKYIR